VRTIVGPVVARGDLSSDEWRTAVGGLYLRDRRTGTTTQIYPSGSNFQASITPDGRYVAFADDTVVMVKDLCTGAEAAPDCLANRGLPRVTWAQRLCGRASRESERLRDLTKPVHLSGVLVDVGHKDVLAVWVVHVW
jgi:hypothetical protein